MADTLETLQRAHRLATRAGDSAAAALLQQELEPLIEAEGARKAAEGMGTVERARANVGAGLATAWQGAKQIGKDWFGVGPGVSDEEVRRTRVLNKALAAATDTGLGPNWAPTMGAALQFTGEVAPTLAIPGAAVGRGAVAATRAALPRVALPPARAKTIAGTAAGVTGGAGGAALMPVTEDESRTQNVLWGGALGSALPLSMAAARSGRNFVRGNAPERIVEGLTDDYIRAHPNATHEAARAAAVNDALTEVTQLQQAGRALPTGAEAVPLSAASMTRNPSLGMKERASRALYPDLWHQFDVEQNQTVWRNLQQATAGADDLATREAARRAGWTAREAEAMANIDPRAWTQGAAQFRAALDREARSPAGQNEMRGVIREIARQMDELGEEFSPQHLARLRSRMASSIRGAGDDVFATAPKSDPYFISLRNEMDAILNRATGNRWQNVLQGYIDESAPVSQAKGMRGIRESFVSPEGVAKVGELGGVPRVTEARLRQSVIRGGENRFGDVLGTEPRSVLTNTIEALNRANYLQQLKLTGTGGGGSNTVMDALAVARKLGPDAGSAGLIMDAIRGLASMGRRAEAEQLMQALTDPDKFVSAVRRAQGSGQRVPPLVSEIAQKLVAGSAGVVSGQPEVNR